MSTIPFHPFANDYPLMSEVEREALAGRMAEAGFDRRFPIVRYEGKILDGRNRYLAAGDAGVDPFYVEFLGSAEEAQQFVIAANEYRRHLSPDWLTEHRRQRVERIQAARRSGNSLRSIAQAESVSEAQVRRDLESGAPGGGAPEPETAPALCLRCQRVGTASCERCREKGAKAEPKVKGRDGKSYSSNGNGNGKKKRHGPKPFCLKDAESHLGYVLRALDDLTEICAERAGHEARFRGHRTSVGVAREKLAEVHRVLVSVGKAVGPGPVREAVG